MTFDSQFAHVPRCADDRLRVVWLASESSQLTTPGRGLGLLATTFALIATLATYASWLSGCSRAGGKRGRWQEPRTLD
jgi:hypothetical protein